MGQLLAVVPNRLRKGVYEAMESSRDAERLVQSVISPSLLDSLTEPDRN